MLYPALKMWPGLPIFVYDLFKPAHTILKLIA